MILLGNAIFQLKTFKEKDRKIIVVAENLADGKIRVLVEDNGGGIAIEHLDSIFSLNFSTKSELGSGIGLALAKKLVEKRLNGRIIVENRSKGASFTILLTV